MFKNISIIGSGNLTQAILSGIRNINSRIVIQLFDKNKNRISIAKKFSCNFSSQINNSLLKSNIILLAVKPNQYHEVCEQLNAHIDKSIPIVSLMAGVKIKNINSIFLYKLQLARVMTNINVKYNNASTFIYSNKLYTKKNQNSLFDFFKLLGSVYSAKSEEYIDKATALSGSGPAYFIYFLESVIKTYINLGFSRKLAEDLAKELFYGTSVLCKNDKRNNIEIIKSIASKGGTTQAALEKMHSLDFKNILSKSVIMALKKAKALGSK